MQIRDMYHRIDVDPTELMPDDVVVALSGYEESGCHCDVRVLVDRPKNGDES